MLGGQMKMPHPVWNKLNLSWALFFVFVGLLNLYVAFVYGTEADPLASFYGGPIADADVRDRHWGYFKVFGLMGLTMVFAMVSMMSVARHIEIDEDADQTISKTRSSKDTDDDSDGNGSRPA